MCAQKMLAIFIIIITCYEAISTRSTAGSSFLAVVHRDSTEDLLHNHLIAEEPSNGTS